MKQAFCLFIGLQVEPLPKTADLSSYYGIRHNSKFSCRDDIITRAA